MCVRGRCWARLRRAGDSAVIREEGYVGCFEEEEFWGRVGWRKGVKFY